MRSMVKIIKERIGVWVVGKIANLFWGLEKFFAFGDKSSTDLFFRHSYVSAS